MLFPVCKLEGRHNSFIVFSSLICHRNGEAGWIFPILSGNTTKGEYIRRVHLYFGRPIVKRVGSTYSQALKDSG